MDTNKNYDGHGACRQEREEVITMKSIESETFWVCPLHWFICHCDRKDNLLLWVVTISQSVQKQRQFCSTKRMFLDFVLKQVLFGSSERRCLTTNGVTIPSNFSLHAALVLKSWAKKCVGTEDWTPLPHRNWLAQRRGQAEAKIECNETPALLDIRQVIENRICGNSPSQEDFYAKETYLGKK